MIGTLVIALLLAPPQGGGDAEPRRTTEFTGSVELTEWEAVDAARAVAGEGTRERVRRAGQAAVEARSPIWLPPFVRGRILDTWVGRAAGRELEVVDRDVRIRDHGFGPSYQATLRVVDPSLRPAAWQELDRIVRSESWRFAVTCGGTVALWALLALGCWWLDRLSRGYMTGRLVALSGVVGIALPGIAFLLPELT